MSGILCPFANFADCNHECNFYLPPTDNDKGHCLFLFSLKLLFENLLEFNKRLEKIEQYALDGSNSLIDIKLNTR